MPPGRSIFWERSIGGTSSCRSDDTAFGAIPAHCGRRACNRRVLDCESAGSILDQSDEQHGARRCHFPGSKW